MDTVSCLCKWKSDIYVCSNPYTSFVYGRFFKIFTQMAPHRILIVMVSNRLAWEYSPVNSQSCVDLFHLHDHVLGDSHTL